jgi:hypothetical protein
MCVAQQSLRKFFSCLETAGSKMSHHADSIEDKRMFRSLLVPFLLFSIFAVYCF